MDLILWRHAEAEDGSPDLERRLTPRGHKHAARVAQWLLQRLPAKFTMLASPARRAQETAQALGVPFRTVADLAPGALCFEFTEAAAMNSLAAATHFIRELRGRGCRFSLDDFGSGLSSFMFLKNLPVDFLKLDGQFMHNVTHDHIDRSMVEAIAQIGESMNIRTVAERVDSADVLARLADIGIQYAQGHYISAPQPVEILESLVRADSEELRLLA